LNARAARAPGDKTVVAASRRNEIVDAGQQDIAARRRNHYSIALPCTAGKRVRIEVAVWAGTLVLEDTREIIHPPES